MDMSPEFDDQNLLEWREGELPPRPLVPEDDSNCDLSGD
jgi:hypothetical protein